MCTAEMSEPPVCGIASSTSDQQQKSAAGEVQEVLLRSKAVVHISRAYK